MQIRKDPSGITLVHLLTGIALMGLVLAGSLSGVLSLTRAVSLTAAAQAVRGDLAYARTVAVARRERIELTLTPDGDLVTLDSRDSVVHRTRLLGADALRLDSIRLRPSTLRFNSRGQAAPGSVYLHSGERNLRLVLSFVGRIREERSP